MGAGGAGLSMDTQSIYWVAGGVAAIAAGMVVFDAFAARAIRNHLIAVGQPPARVRRRWLRRLFVRGFSLFGAAYWVTLESDEGRRRLFGYEPAGWLMRGASGVKRFSGGVWRDEFTPRRVESAADPMVLEAGVARSQRRAHRT